MLWHAWASLFDTFLLYWSIMFVGNAGNLAVQEELQIGYT